MYSPLHVTWRPVLPEFGTGYLYSALAKAWPASAMQEIFVRDRQALVTSAAVVEFQQLKA